MDLQKLANVMNDMCRNTRTDYHLTLDKAIKMLSDMPPALPIQFDWNGEYPDSGMSYRGYYSDLSFDWKPTKTTVREFLKECKAALDETYTGYKGGDYIMDGSTPLWAAEYGNTGRAIIGINQDDKNVVLETKDMYE